MLKKHYPDRQSRSDLIGEQRRCYWLRAKYQMTWRAIAKELDLRHATKAYDNAYRYSIRHRYPWPMVNAKCFGQDVYIDRQNGLSWHKISKKRGRLMTACKNSAQGWAKRHGYRWPPYQRGS